MVQKNGDAGFLRRRLREAIIIVHEDKGYKITLTNDENTNTLKVKVYYEGIKVIEANKEIIINPRTNV